MNCTLDFKNDEFKRKTTKFTGKKCLIPIKRNQLTINITYIKRNGSSSVARVIFKNIKAGETFLKTISSFTGIKAFPLDKNETF